MAEAKDIEAQQRRDASRAQQLASAIARETDAALRRASRRTRAAVNAVLAEQRATARGGGSSTVAQGWARPPSPTVYAAVSGIGNAPWAPSRRSPGGNPADGDPSHATFHFKLSESHDAGAAQAHQRYIEREAACIASFGNLGETQVERIRLWKSIGERAHTKSGSVTVDFTNDPVLASRVIESLPEWTALDLIQGPTGRAIAVRAKAAMQGEAPREDKPAADERITIETSEGDAPQRSDVSKRAGRHRAQKDKKSPEHSVLLWTKSADTQQHVIDQVQAWMTEEQRKQRLRVRRPREPIIQRRMVLELAHELDDEARGRALERWCQDTFGPAKVAWHSAIHVPESDLDEVDYHTHLLRSATPSMRAGSRWSIARCRRPPSLPTSFDTPVTLEIGGGRGGEKR